MGAIKLFTEIRYQSDKQQKEVDQIVAQLKSEGWKIDGPAIHKPGLRFHSITMKRSRNGFKIQNNKGKTLDSHQT